MALLMNIKGDILGWYLSNESFFKQFDRQTLYKIFPWKCLNEKTKFSTAVRWADFYLKPEKWISIEKIQIVPFSQMNPSLSI